jgi:SNF2 family DNA or RNA helicase
MIQIGILRQIYRLLSRAYRIGQTREVRVFRLVTKNSYEMEMFSRASMKLGLDKALIMTKHGEP